MVGRCTDALGNHTMARSSFLVKAALLLCAALLFRIAVNPLPLSRGADSFGYEAKAVSLSQGEGYRYEDRLTSFKPPGYSAFLAGLYRLLGHADRVVWAVQLGLGVLICLCVLLIGRSIFSEAVGFWAAVITSFSLPMARASGWLLTEALAAFLLVIVIGLGVAFLKQRKLWLALLMGVSAAALIFTKSAMILFPFCWFGWLTFKLIEASSRKDLLRLFLGLLVCLFCLSLWTVRNWRVQGQPVLLSTAGGRAFYASYCPPDGFKFGMNSNDSVDQQADQMTHEVERDRFYYQSAFRWIAGHPNQLPKLLFYKGLYAFSPWDWELISQDGTARYHWVYGLFFLPVCIGIIKIVREPMAGVVLIPLGYFLFLSFVFYGSPRFRLPFEPYGALAAAYGLTALVQGRFGRSMSAWMAAGIVLFIGLTYGLMGCWRGWI